MNILAVKELAQSYSAQQLEQCLSSEISEGHSYCQLSHQTTSRETAIDSLAKAQVVRAYMESEQVPLNDGLRELARRMRSLH
ncbi:MAG: hypothetical protein AB4050_18055 [Synechococcus sp.]